MFNIKYNALAVIGVVISFLCSILQIKVFGVTAQTDAYMLAVSIISALNLFQLLFVEQFMFFYNDYKAENIKKAHAFYQSVIVTAFLWGIIFFIISIIFVKQIIFIFASGLDPNRVNLLLSILSILLITTICYPLIYVNDQLMNAEMKISIPYILNMLPNIAVLLSYIFIFIYNINDIIVLVYAHIIGFLIAFFIRFIFVKYYFNIPFKFKIDFNLIKNFIINSFSMRFAHNLNNLIINPITNTILSYLSAGNVSCYYYAQKFIVVLQNVVAGPSNIILGTKLSYQWSNKKFDKISNLIKIFLKIMPALFIVSATIVYLIIPYFLKLIASNKVSATNIDLIQILFLLLCIWQLIILFEAPFARIIIVSKKSKILLMINIIFFCNYFFTTYFGKEFFGIKVIPTGGMAAQIISFILCIISTKIILREVQKGNT